MTVGSRSRKTALIQHFLLLITNTQILPIFYLIIGINNCYDYNYCELIIILVMYNAFIQRKQTIQSDTTIKKSENNKKYVDRYYNVTRPALIDNYNKRINSFIRRMEQEPIQISLDPYLRTQKQLNKIAHKSKGGKRTFSSMAENRNEQQKQQLNKTHYQTFKFKNNEDWISLFTPFQRIQRKKNFELFKQKYGDPSIAYRSIGSQSQYKPGHEFRQRSKGLQINPPMKYTNKPTKQILAQLKNRMRNKKKQHLHTMGKNHEIGESKDEDFLIRRNNTSSSFSGINQDNLLSEAADKLSRYEKQSHDGDKETQNYGQHSKNERLKKKEVKIHFKELMDLEQNISDLKTKKALRDILYRCGVYRKKNRKTLNDSQVDQLSQFIDIRDH